VAATLLPHSVDGSVDWATFEAHVNRTAEAGLIVAANMDTGYVQLLTDQDKQRVLDIVTSVCSGNFVAGAYVMDKPMDPLDIDAYRRQADAISQRGGTPVVFPSHGLNELDDNGWIAALETFGQDVDRFIGFELGPMFVPYGRIVGLEAYRALLEIPSCIGAKHSSLDRAAEWERLAIRDQIRPDFRVFTGNDCAIDMVMWGSDYLLGLATFAPAEFARRDRYWAAGDERFFELNDVLQSLGSFSFREPVPAYRHDAAMMLQLRGWAETDGTPAGALRRPASDRDVLAEIVERLQAL
jgi:dihydrodipicolinate synthase/N-acetylneuraminate lyase